MSRAPLHMGKHDHDEDTEEVSGRSSPFNLPIGLPKRAKSHLHLNGNSSQASLSRPSIDSDAPRPSHDSPARPSYDSVRSFHSPSSPTSSFHDADENDTARSPLGFATGSVRSILRGPKTPGTGQNVRFFSRDAYKVISPDASLTSTMGQEPKSLIDQFQAATMPVGGGKARRPGMSLDLFTPPKEREAKQPELTTSIPSADLSGIFGADIPPIHSQGEGSTIDMPMFDLSVEQNAEEGGFTSTPHKPGGGEMFHSMLEGVSEEHEHQPALLPSHQAQETEHPLPMPHPLHIDTTPSTQTGTPPASAREVPLPASAVSTNASFSFGQTVFYSMSKPTHTPSSSISNLASAAFNSAPGSEKSRHSDSSSIFRGMGMGVFSREHRNSASSGKSAVSTSTTGTHPAGVEADINDCSTDSLALSVAFDETEREADRVRRERERDREQPDPFRANATTYYTPQTLIPPTPPPNKPPVTHVRMGSKEDHDVIWSLKTQLALQQELCAQYEIDLSARDALVASLTQRITATEEQGEKRKGALRAWKKKVAELERMTRGLQEEVERSREESFERSVMDEASGEALKCLQRRIGELERERGDVERRAASAEDARTRAEAVLRVFGTELGMAMDRDARELSRSADDADAELQQEKEKHSAAKTAWEEERALLIMRGAQVENSRTEITKDLVQAQEALAQKDNEYGVLQAELEAQWAHTERGSERIRELERRVAEAEAQLVEEQAHSEALERAMEAQAVQLADAQAEHAFATENVTRLEDHVRQRDSEIADFSSRVVEREIAAEALREELSALRREHARVVDAQARAAQDEIAIKGEMEAAVKARAEAEVAVGTLKDQVGALREEVERLRRHVHELQQESADKEMSLAQMAKQRAQDKEDMAGLNIALDSKQQELELLKRKLGVKGTAGSTPAPAKIAHHRRESLSSTPGIVRPPSALSDTGRDTHRGLETPVSIPKALSRSVRANAGASVTPKASGAMGPPAAKAPRPSMGTPTPTASRLNRAASAKPTASAVGTPTSGVRRAASTMLMRAGAGASGRKISESSVPSELDEKENVGELPPAPAPVGVVRRRVSELQMGGAARA
ncbi:hypothetical protein HWV62_1388 [Athelia sp. TMB]|nr:hypothetical protein HWV62_1388 [Athelia sp. TMB]